MDFENLSTIPIAERGGKVQLEHMGTPPPKGVSFSRWLDGLPKILAADSLRGVVAALIEAKRKRRAILWGMGGHVAAWGAISGASIAKEGKESAMMGYDAA